MGSAGRRPAAACSFAAAAGSWTAERMALHQGSQPFFGGLFRLHFDRLFCLHRWPPSLQVRHFPLHRWRSSWQVRHFPLHRWGSSWQVRHFPLHLRLRLLWGVA
jgi:hypothetical protein